MSNQQIQDIEENIGELRNLVEKGKALERLMINRDFKELVVEGYFEKEAIRLVHAKANPSCQGPDQQRAIITAIDAIGCFHSFLGLIRFNASRAVGDIEDSEQALEDLRAEDMNNG